MIEISFSTIISMAATVLTLFFFSIFASKKAKKEGYKEQVAIIWASFIIGVLIVLLFLYK